MKPPPKIFLRLKIWHAIGQFEQEIGSPSAARAFMGVVARAEVMDRHPLSYLVRVSEEVPPTYLAYSWAHLGRGGVAGRHHRGLQGAYPD